MPICCPHTRADPSTAWCMMGMGLLPAAGQGANKAWTMARDTSMAEEGRRLGREEQGGTPLQRAGQ